MKVRKVAAGHYRTDTGLDILREDVPSLAEWDVPSGDVTWYVLTTREADQGQALPDAMFEAATLAECKRWAAAHQPSSTLPPQA